MRASFAGRDASHDASPLTFLTIKIISPSCLLLLLTDLGRRKLSVMLRGYYLTLNETEPA
jgi:hypothetical protein